ncbi:stage III sporulation protein AE [Flavonifractor plautii]|uniref:stage III sporulation protein AE n=1 Tax=Flavonifractor plautii TaxID=292800 RepID=UPI00195EBDED|nr:stage III sporulation protein AE [Flavonifractor plautii]MBM6663848.1 stage III sporulation protein AE [Flavonifractor plautii]
MIRRLAVLVVLLTVLTGTAWASQGVLEAQSDALDLEGLENAGAEWMPDVDLSAGLDLDGSIGQILDTGSAELGGVIRKALRSGALLLAVTAIAAADANSLIGMGREAIEHMDSFSKLLLPAVTAAASAAGSPGGAVARQLATMLFSDLLITLINRVLLPLVYTYIAACVAWAAVGNDGLKRMAATLKWAVTTVLTGTLILFVTYLTISGVIAGTTDALTVKAAKFTMSSMVPVVGGILSDAAETVLAGAGVLKNTVGVFGMLVVIGICLVPFLQLGFHYLTYKVSSALSAALSGSRVASLIDQIGGAFGLILGMTGACALLLLISMISAVSLAGG